MRSLFVLLLAASPAFAQKEFGFDNKKSSGQEYLSPAETVKRMKVPDEFEVKLFAGEPDCVNPVAFTIDEKGRVWVVECFEYPSRTPKGKAPRDRIVILEDTDGDGVCDKRTIFAEGKDFPVSEERKKAGLGAFDLATGIEVGHGGVYFGAPPYLYFIENKDDKPGKFETLLSGFGSQDTHETLNTFQWGPDGWLYGLQGVYTQSNVKSAEGPEVKMNAAVWRLHPKTKKFEIFAEGTSNPWGMDWRNTDGQFILACCVIPHLYHIVPGGIYRRQGGTSYNPYAYGYINEISDHTFHKESGWAHAGLVSLDAPHIPERFRNSVIFGSIHGCSVKQNILKPNGSTYTASRGDDFLVSGDKNVRPINLRWGPHGDIYMIDWHDQNPCHQAQAGSWDYERGRVYRIQLKDRKGGKVEDLGKKSAKELATLAISDDPYTYRTALQQLVHRKIENPRATFYEAVRANRNLPMARIMALATALPLDEENDKISNPQLDRVEELPPNGDALIRAMSESPHVTANTIKMFAKIAGIEKQTVVRRELASAAIRLGDKHDVSELLHALMKHSEDSKDPLIPNLVWIAYEKVIAKNAANEMGFLAEQSPTNIFVRDAIVPKVMRRLVATNKPEDLALCLKFVADVKDSNTREKALDGLVTAFKGQTVAPPAAWAALQEELRKDAKLIPLVNKLAVSFRDPAALKRALAVLVDVKLPAVERSEALRQVILLQAPNSETLLLDLIAKDPAESVRIEAVRLLPSLEKPTLGDDVLKLWKDLPAIVRAEAVQSLAARKPWAVALLKAMEKKLVERTLLTDNTVLKMQAFNNAEINGLIEKAWGRTRPTPAELNKLIDLTRDKLDETPASFARGKAVFEMQCVKCHKFDGKGVEVGPPLDGAGRDIEYLLANVIDPNRVIGAPYFLRTLNTLDGRVEQGLLAEEDDNSITLKVENAQLKKFQKKDLDGPVKILEKSMMPEGLTAGMTPQNFRDLIRYVMAHPHLTEVTVNGKALSSGVTGRIPLPMEKEITIEAEFTAADALKTKLLIGSSNAFTVKLDGKPIGTGAGTGKAARPDGEAIDVELPKGKHTLTFTTSNSAAAGAAYLRFLDPDRKLSYPEK
jgi:putative membrane-bound dehydrogenase-like protein